MGTAGVLKHGSRGWAFDSDGRDRAGYVFNGYVVGNDVAVQMLEQFLASFGLCVEQKMVVETENVDVA